MFERISRTVPTAGESIGFSPTRRLYSRKDWCVTLLLMC
jgi:hypothetical protein